MLTTEYDPINKLALAIIERNEGCVLHCYLDTRGIPTIGYGHTGKDVFQGRVISQEVAEALLRSDLSTAEMGVDDAIGDQCDTTDNQFGAMVSLTYNIGVGAFAKSSVALHHRLGNYDQAANDFLKYDMSAGRMLQPLLRRRQEERALYLKADDDATGAPG